MCIAIAGLIFLEGGKAGWDFSTEIVDNMSDLKQEDKRLDQMNLCPPVREATPVSLQDIGSYESIGYDAIKLLVMIQLAVRNLLIFIGV